MQIVKDIINSQRQWNQFIRESNRNLLQDAGFSTEEHFKRFKRYLEDENFEALNKIMKKNQKIDIMYGRMFNCVINKPKAMQWLITNGYNINLEYDYDNPLINAFECFNKDRILFLIENGASIHIKDYSGHDIFQRMIGKVGAKNTDKIITFMQLAEELGRSIKEYGGEGFLSAVFNVHIYDDLESEYMKIIDYFLKQGVDINYRSTYTKITALYISAWYENLKMCKYLVKHGANPLIGDRTGERPYTKIYDEYSLEISHYLKSLEPKGLHDTKWFTNNLLKQGLPKQVIDICLSEDRVFKLVENINSKDDYVLIKEYIEKGGDICFKKITKIVSCRINNISHLSLSIENNNTRIYFNLENKSIAICSVYYYVNYVEEKYEEIGGVEEFINMLKPIKLVK
ncbi:hypothetical protein AN396_08885 [Candidatus Epulonipiscium fishelsonii]|uniref:Uncharacterized protein n=1 Tax=Candidatus Epulonipiscium fishelsonii TaxID=77094 RepID=A0ACC8XAG6_9FIRM|nr:hypothetical protein AN396_08885 [Epulopiscium sp. SCG-B11WGA-EpuloA1]